MDEFAKNFPLIAAVVVVLGLLFKAIPLYDAYNDKKAAAARAANDEVVEKERKRLEAETKARLADDDRWDLKLRAAKAEWESVVKDLRVEISDLRSRVRRHEHQDARNRQTMYTAAWNLKGVAGGEDVMRDLLAAARIDVEEPDAAGAPA